MEFHDYDVHELIVMLCICYFVFQYHYFDTSSYIAYSNSASRFVSVCDFLAGLRQ